MRHLLRVLIVMLCISVFAGVALAQETTGVIRGTVTDPSGAVIPGAKVEASGVALGRALAASTDSTGSYIFANVPPGNYTVSISAAGFVTVKQTDVVVEVGRATTVPVKMEVGAVTETVNVSGQALMVDTRSSTSAVNVSSEFLDRLPKGRGFDSLIALAPGARNEPRGGGFQLDGASAAENIYVIDGMEVTNMQTGALPGQTNIPTEFVQELQVKSTGFGAEYGGAMGGVVNVVTKSGGNDWHGQASLYYNGDRLNGDSRPTLRLLPTDDNKFDYFQNVKDPYRFLNPGFQLGGPIKKDKLWIISSYYPYLSRWQRNVTFLRDNSTKDFEQRARQDFWQSKLDFAPVSKLRTSFGYLYSPYRLNGSLPSKQGTDSPFTDYANLGNRQPMANYTWDANLAVTPRFVVDYRGGYNYRNYKDYGIPRGAFFLYATPNVNGVKAPDGTILTVPDNVKAASGAFTANNRQTVKDIQTRLKMSADGSYIANIGGQQHSFKFGYDTNRLHNTAFAGTWPDGYFRIYWGSTRQGIVVPGKMRGTYGYYIDRRFATNGDVGSNNTGFFFQDSWQVSKRLTLNLGLRDESEFLPSFRTDIAGIKSHAIEFGFGEKLAPRLGFAFDLLGNGKAKVYASFGLFYDMMKYEMPRGSFGGDQWKDYVHPLDDPDITKLSLTNTPGALFETVDWRIPSNDPSDNTIDPNLKPMRKRVYDAGFEYSATPTVVLTARYTHNSLDRAIEDVGTLGPQGEKYFIANPGLGLTADPKTWGPGFPVTPKARRDYDAVELRANKRYSKGLSFAASYTWSREYGNYGGLASSDENGRFSPNVNRYFDLPFMSFDKTGKEVLGLLATDRPHTFKAFGSYELKSKLGTSNFGPAFQFMSGTPLTTEVSMVSSVPIFVNGRGDLGRTPFWSQTDFYITHEFHLARSSERYKIKLEATFANLFDQDTAYTADVGYNHGNDGQVNFDNDADFFKGFDYKAMMAAQGLRTNPAFGHWNRFQGPRNIRFGIHFIF